MEKSLCVFRIETLGSIQKALWVVWGVVILILIYLTGVVMKIEKVYQALCMSAIEMTNYNDCEHNQEHCQIPLKPMGFKQTYCVQDGS